jgi:peptidoglycan/xylan/chitin deacetylase (PgdA/CDA1 family)
MNLVAFSIRTKGAHNFARRLWTVFARFGFSDARSRRTLLSILATVRQYGGSPTFFIPAVVLRRHPELINEIALCGAEIGIHGYVHNDYRSLSDASQHQQTQQAMAVFHDVSLPFEGFRNPYLGWTDDAVRSFEQLGFTYDSNEAIVHDALDLSRLTPTLRSGFEKSLELFQAIAPSAYTLRPHFEGELARIPTSIPDDEMLFDRLRITDQVALGDIWRSVMARVYDLGGIYVLNLHPERGVLCKPALGRLLAFSQQQELPVWVASLREVEQWWRERRAFRFTFEATGEATWRVTASCTPRTTILARHLTVDGATASPWSGAESRVDGVDGREFTVHAGVCPCVALSPRTSSAVEDFLLEEGYPVQRVEPAKAPGYAHYLDMSDGLGETRAEQIARRSALLAEIEALEQPLLRFGVWPDRARAALSITGDIDSITIQDFFLRIVEARQQA